MPEMGDAQCFRLMARQSCYQSSLPYHRYPCILKGFHSCWVPQTTCFTSSKVPDAVGTTFAPYAASRPASLMPKYTKCSGKATATFMQDRPFPLPTIDVDVFPSYICKSGRRKGGARLEQICLNSCGVQHMVTRQLYSGTNMLK